MGRQRTALVVDDEPHIRYMLQFKLAEAGFHVTTATNTQEAYEAALSSPPCIMVADLQMPGTDGLALCQQMATDPETARIPIIMLTTRGQRIPSDQLEQTNVRCLLAKPFSPRELIRRIGEILEEQDQITLPGAKAA